MVVNTKTNRHHRSVDILKYEMFIIIWLGIHAQCTPTAIERDAKIENEKGSPSNRLMVLISCTI